MPKTGRAAYTRGLESGVVIKYIKGKTKNGYRSVLDFLKAEDNKEFKDVSESMF